MSTSKLGIDRAELFSLLADMIAINSVNPAFDREAPGEGKLGQFVADYLMRHKIPFDMQEVQPGRFNIIGRVKGQDSRRALLFDAHLDTVSTILEFLLKMLFAFGNQPKE